MEEAEEAIEQVCIFLGYVCLKLILKGAFFSGDGFSASLVYSLSLEDQ